VVSEHRKNFFAFYSRGQGEFTMPLRRRGRQSPDPEEEREMSRERGRPVQNPDMERGMRNLRARMEDMEISKGAKLIQEILVNPKMKMMLDMKKRKSQRKMQPMNV
jgi:hypothetical protein